MIAVQVQIDALEQMLEVENTVATPLKDFDFVVETFDEAAVVAIDEVVGDFFPPGLE
ncbi:MAG: hypothetical protein WCA79_07210 [Anaerolineales bacterium]